MQVRLKTGRYAGELQDVRPDSAKQMINDGRATDPRIEGELAVERLAQVEEVRIPAVHRRRRNRGN